MPRGFCCFVTDCQAKQTIYQREPFANMEGSLYSLWTGPVILHICINEILCRHHRIGERFLRQIPLSGNAPTVWIGKHGIPQIAATAKSRIFDGPHAAAERDAFQGAAIFKRFLFNHFNTVRKGEIRQPTATGKCTRPNPNQLIGQRDRPQTAAIFKRAKPDLRHTARKDDAL